MPHKRARRSIREQEKAQRATDLAPTVSIEHEPVPKSVSRVLDAGQIRREYRKKRRYLDGVGDSDESDVRHKKRHHDARDMNTADGETTALRIKPGETVAQFNRRVESSMTPLIRTALRQSSAQARKVRREAAAQETLKRGKQGDHARPPASSKKGSDPPPAAAGHEEDLDRRSVTREFQVVSTSAPRRLNDVVQEPPLIKKLPRGAKHDAAPPGVLSMAQKARMEEERDKAISRYRELKARKLRESGRVKYDS